LLSGDRPSEYLLNVLPDRRSRHETRVYRGATLPSMPAGPPPTTTIVRPWPLCLGFSNSRSLPRFRFTAHLTWRWLSISWKQERQPMHLRIVWAFPAWALLHHSGSARCPRATPMKSQHPSTSICSATSGSLMLQTAMIGMFTCFFISAAIYLFQPCS